ncbi:MAG: type I 3-dehydroquinate dehydratase [Holophagales bacterium]|jgi:3-dehydroquinate dehydratase type I|nr:type I 3-dehydroquinate dehydratase [Holophagales bacterium]
MSLPPFYIVPLTHSDWEDARAYAKKLPNEAIAEVRLDLTPDADPEYLVDSLKRRCVVSSRRVSEGGRWPDEDEAGRLESIKKALKGRPQWIDLEWDLEIPDWLEAELTHTRLLRSFHAPPAVFDLEARLQEPPRGDAYKWVGHASRLSDNTHVKSSLAWARDHHIALSAFLTGNKGIVSRCMQAAWGGAFVYAAPDNAAASAPGQLKLGTMTAWRCHKLHPSYGLCGVLGSPVIQSAGPAFHNLRFQRSFKDLIYLPLEAQTPAEAMDAMKSLSLLGASVTMPLKETLSAILNFSAPINTMWRRADGDVWQATSTDAEALEFYIKDFQGGPVLVLGSGGVAKTSMRVIEKRGWPALQCSRRSPAPVADVARFAPAGVIQATSLGMGEDDPMPFPEVLEAALPSLRWAAEWVNSDATAFSAWASGAGLQLLSGAELFEKQAALQSRIFVTECGGL